MAAQYERDLVKYKNNFTFVDLPNVSEKSFTDFKKLLYYSPFDVHMPGNKFKELMDRRRQLAEEISERIPIDRDDVAKFFQNNKDYKHKFPGYNRAATGEEAVEQQKIQKLLDRYHDNQVEISKKSRLTSKQETILRTKLENSRKSIHQYLGLRDEDFIETKIDNMEKSFRADPNGVNLDERVAKSLWGLNRGFSTPMPNEYLKSYRQFTEAKKVLVRKELPYGDDFSFFGRNCSCATGMSMEVLYEGQSLYRKGFIPADPLDNLQRATRMKAKMEGSARSSGIGDYLGISRLLDSASYGAHYLGNLLARGFFLSEGSKKRPHQCIADTLAKFADASETYSIDLNTKAINFVLLHSQILQLP